MATFIRKGKSRFYQIKETAFLDLELKQDTELGLRQYYCPHCGYTWIELVGGLISKKSGATDVHMHFGSGTSPECKECGCSYAHQTAMHEESVDMCSCLDDVMSLLKERRETYKP